MRNRWWTRREDDGFTLVEVIVALTLLGIVAAAALTFFIRGTAGARAMQQKQVAVALANQALDRARAIKPANLIQGRPQNVVQDAWTASSATPLTFTYKTWDSTSPTPTTLVPVIATQTVSAQSYDVVTHIGVCFRDRGDTTGSHCTGNPGTLPTTTPTGKVRMYRVVVEVKWKAAGNATGCTNGRCLYEADTLIDANADPAWNIAAAPFPQPTTMNIPAQVGSSTPVDLRILNNATNVDSDTTFVITAINAQQGQLKVDGSDYNANTKKQGKILTYTPQQNVLGTWSVTYYLTNSDGQVSEPVTTTFNVVPVAVNDAPTTAFARNSSTSYRFGDNDKPMNFGGAVVLNGPVSLTSGSCTNVTADGNGNVFFKTPNAGGTCVFSYSIKGTGSYSSLVSDPATITVKF